MYNTLFVSNEAEIILYSAQNTEAKLQRELQILSLFMNFHQSDGSHIGHNMPKRKQHFSGVDHSYQQ